MFSLKNSPFVIPKTFEAVKIPTSTRSTVVCAAKGPRPRYPRVWKTKRKIGTISKSAKLVQTIKDMSNVKEEVYGALDSFVAWELEFPLITVKKALKTLEDQQEWKRIIQVIKWMLSKGQGSTMGSYFMLINALAEDDRLEEAEELWTKLLMQHMESMPRKFFDKMISIYHTRGMHQKMFEVFADMEELGIQPSIAVVSMVGNVFLELGMQDKYEKLNRKYPPPKWVYRYIKGKRIKIKVRRQVESNEVCKDLEKPEDAQETSYVNGDRGHVQPSDEFDEEFEQDSDDMYEEPEQTLNDMFEKTEPDFDVNREKAEINSDD